jgi:hypothetical protein
LGAVFDRAFRMSADAFAARPDRISGRARPAASGVEAGQGAAAVKGSPSA